MGSISNPEQYEGLEAVAIVGMAGRFPKAANIDAFWRNLTAGVDSSSWFSAAEMESAGVKPAELEKPGYVPSRAILEDAEWFDAGFFGISPREADTIDPQHRIFLECAWETLENAGYDPETFPGAIGVFAGASMNTYLINHIATHPDLVDMLGDFQLMLGNDNTFMASRTAYKLNLKGLAVNVQTACSTSLAAVAMACQSLLDYQCDMALAGGASLLFPQKRGYVHRVGGILSSDGHCRAFDAEADGTFPGQGVGIVALKRLEDALADGDNIRAIIRGAAMNNDGSMKIGYTAPSVEGQAEVIAMAQALADIEPASIGYIEAHGTGTPLGDPIEMAGLMEAFAMDERHAGTIAIGSVKTNIGHLDTAAGVAGLIKAVLVLENEAIPPSLHYTRPNEKIDFASGPFYVNDKLQPWPRGGAPRRAGVSSFGIGGTNVHVVLEEAPARKASEPATDTWQLLPLSARTPTALAQVAAQLAAYLRATPELDLADVAYTLQVGRHPFEQRRLVVGRTTADVIAALDALMTTDTDASLAQLPGDAVGESLAVHARAWLDGQDVDWASLHEDEERQRVALPTYPFERKRYFIEPRPAVGEVTRRQAFEDWFYAPRWEAQPLSATTRPAADSWLLFMDELGLGAALADQLRAAGRSVTEVWPGDDFVATGDRAYQVRPGEAADYRALVAALVERGQWPGAVVHLWRVTREQGDEPTAGMEYGFYSVMFLLQAFGKGAQTQPVHVQVVANRLQAVAAGDVVEPEKATLLGPARVGALELVGISASVVDIDVTDATDLDAVATQLLAEADAPGEAELIAYRGATRWVQTIERIEAPAPTVAQTRLRPNGVYLVTGGLGGVGLALAEWIAQATENATIVLTSRSGLPPRETWAEQLQTADERTVYKIRNVQAMAQFGADVVIMAADAADPEAMTTVVETVRERYGALHGIIHAAGVAGGGAIRGQDRDGVARVLAPKVLGTAVLMRLLQSDQPDFIVLCSSIDAVAPALGQTDYVAANAYLDATAQAARTIGASERATALPVVVSINWDAWREVGMAVDIDLPAPLRQQRLANLRSGILTAEGVKALTHALNAGVPQVVVSTRTFEARRAASAAPPVTATVANGAAADNGAVSGAALQTTDAGRSNGTAQHARPELDQAYVPPQTVRQQQIAAIWQKHLGIEQVGIHDDFFELGGSSLLALNVFPEIEAISGQKLPIAVLFEAPTIAQLAVVVGDDGTPVVRDAKPVVSDEATSAVTERAAPVEAGVGGRRAWSSLVPIRPTGDKPPLFLIHAAGGNVLFYRELVSYLDRDQPVYGLQAQGLDGEQPVLEDIASMASLYIQEMQRVRPHGPYLVGGYCMGGSVAYEIAQQLRDKGEEVALVALFETYNWANMAWGKPHIVARYFIEKLGFHWRNFVLLSNREKRIFIGEKVKVLRQRLGVYYGMIASRLGGKTKADAEPSLRAGEIWESNDEAALSYVPAPYDGRVVHFVPIKEYTRHRGEALQWDDLAGGGVEQHIIPVYPGGMLVEPFVAQTATLLTASIDDALAEGASEPETAPAMIALSAADEAGLKARADQVAGDLAAVTRRGELDDVAAAANDVALPRGEHRLGVTARTAAEARQALQAYVAGRDNKRLVVGRGERLADGRIAFLFTGQGSQYAGMARALYAAEPVFRETLDRCAHLLEPHLARPLLDVIYPPRGAVDAALIDETAYTQPALFALEYALAVQWRAWGVEPAALLGHSVGEYVAACVAGIFSLEDALQLIAARGRLMQSLEQDGAMLVAFAAEEMVNDLIAPYAAELSLAAINGPTNSVISGAAPAVAAVRQQLEAANITVRPLNVSHAFHSPLMEPMLDAFGAVAEQVTYAAPQIPIVSNVTGQVVSGLEMSEPAYWVRHIRAAVRYAASIQWLADREGVTAFLEVGPHPALIGMGKRCLTDEEILWLPSLRRNRNDREQLLHTALALWANGYDIALPDAIQTAAFGLRQ